MNSKIRAEHLNRPAMVYIRQSSLIQVLENKQSTERQYNLEQLAIRYGWDAAQVEVIDEDLGQSGASTNKRTGFQRLAAEVSLGKIGAIFSLEVSRLARSSADWHRLLDLCALSNTLIIDDDGIYDPNDFNDRLVLGMKGTMSDAERHVMRLRLQGGQRHKAKKGDLAFPSPTGYVFNDGVIAFDPDEQVQKAVRLLFERFRLDGSAMGVVRYFSRNGLLFPSRHARKDAPAEMRWRKLTDTRTISILRNPIFAGAYAWGRTQAKRTLIEGSVRSRRTILTARDQWHALRFDAHPAYISWEEHVENIRRLEENSWKVHRNSRGAPRNGDALLQGIALCGKCGRRMYPVYHEPSYPVYQCGQHHSAEGMCWSTTARRIDEAVTKVLLEAIAPPELDLSLAVLREVEHQAGAVDRQWKLRLERARYEAERAERQYNSVEPENRVVVRTLESRWNDKLTELAQVEREHEAARRVRKLELSEADKKAILALAKDLPKVWKAETTTAAERKLILRLVIQEVLLTPVDVPKRMTRINVLWKTGATTELFALRPSAAEAVRVSDEAIAVVRELAGNKHSDSEIAIELAKRNFTNKNGLPFNARSVLAIRSKNGIAHGSSPGKPIAEQDTDGRYSVRGLATRYGVTHHIVRYWIERGVLSPVKDAAGRFWLELTPEIELRIEDALKLGNGPRDRPGSRAGGSRQMPVQFADGSFSTRGLAERFAVTHHVVRYWMEKGFINPERNAPYGNFRFVLTPDIEQRLHELLARRGNTQSEQRAV